MAPAPAGGNYKDYLIADVLSLALPRRLAYGLGGWFADRFFLNDTRGREAVCANHRHMLRATGIEPAEDVVRSLGRQTFRQFSRYLVDFFRYRRLSPGQVRKLVTIEGFEHFERAWSLGRGLMIVTAHLGNWELGGAVLRALGYPVNAVVLPHRNQRTERLFESRRKSRGVRLIPLGQDAGIASLAALQRHECLAVLMDRDYSRHTVTQPFFNAPAQFPRGPATLAALARVPVLPGFMLREVDDTFRLRIHAPVMPKPGLRIEGIQASMCRGLEREVRERPTQWFMFESFWSGAATGGQGREGQRHGGQGHG